MEMDERTMTDVPALAPPLIIALAFLGGALLGWAFFRALRRTTELIIDGDHMLLALALTVGRLALIGAGFYLAALAGGVAILATLAGVLCAKALLLKGARGIGARGIGARGIGA
jgi:hypothetical protein